MKPGGLYAAIAVLAVLGGLVWWSNKHPSADPEKAPEQPKILTLESKDIEGIKIVHSGADPIELKKESEIWSITAPRPMAADSEQLAPLTGNIAAIKGERLLDENATDLVPYGLKDPQTEVDVTVKGGKQYQLLIGGDTPSGGNSYFKLGDSPKVYTISITTKGDLNKTINDLRDKRLMTFNYEKLKSLTLSTDKTAQIEFGKNDADKWQLVKPRVMRADFNEFDNLTRRLKDARMDIPADYNAKSVQEMYTAGKKIAEVHAVDDKVNESLEIHKGNDNNYYAKSSLDPGYYKVSSDTGEGLDKSFEDFRAKKVFEFRFEDPSKISINDKTYEKQGGKTEEKWMLNGVQFDAVSMLDVFDKLRDLTATKLDTKKAGTPTWTFTITYGDKHRTEKVVLNKDGNNWNAVRDDDPGTVYNLEPANVEDVQKMIGAIKQYTPPKDDSKKK